MQFWIEARSHPVRTLKTACLFAAYATIGLATGTVGPTLLDLRQQVQTDLRTIATVVTARTGGHAVGSVASKSGSISKFNVIA